MQKTLDTTLTLECTCGKATIFKIGQKLICQHCGLVVGLAWGLGDHTFTGLKERKQ